MKKIYLCYLFVLVVFSAATAQPGAVGNNNITGTPFFCTTLSAPSFAFSQARIQANQNAVAATWEFPATCSYPGDVWRPYFAGSAALAFNTTIAPNGGGNTGALYNSANGGAPGTLSPTTNGNYYTFNIQNVTAPNNAYMAVLETNYNPVTITSVSNTTPANASNSVMVTCTVSSAPSPGEYIYVRYSSDFYVTSSLSLFTFTGTTGRALLPCHAGGTAINYYVMSSNRTAAQLTADAALNGQIAYDMLTLNLNNNGGPNYNYTQGTGTNFGGVYSTPSTCYATVSAFATALNAGTVTAPVDMYAIGGSATETATAGGIPITKTGTVANPIVFQKFGTGAYTIQASAALTVGSVNDAIIKLIGADYITIDGLTLQENAANTTNTVASNNMTEWGVALLNASTTDGPQNNTIQHNNISLNRSYIQSFGVYSNARHSATSVTVTADVTNNTTGPHNLNKIYSNTISNVNMGITFIGVPAAANQDVGNDIGGSSAATGNTITNWGGAAATTSYVSNTGTSYCIFLNHQTGENVSYNTITSAAVSGTNVTFRGIFKDYSSGSPNTTFTSTISHNTITMNSGFTANNFECIRSQNLTSLSTATINITHNNLLNNAITAAGTTSAFGGIINSSACGILNITNNIMRGLTSTSVSGGFTGISNSGAVVTTINITNNKIGDAVSGAATYSVGFTNMVNVITNTGGASTATININNNSIDGISIVTSGQVALIQNQAASAVAVNINNNQLGTVTGSLITLTGAQSSAIFFLYNGGATATTNVSFTGNDIRGVNHVVMGSGQHQYIRSNTAALSVTIANNTFTNLNINNLASVYLIMDIPAKPAGANTLINNNSIVTGLNKSGSGGTLYLIQAAAASVSGSTSVITNNSFTNITLAGSTAMTGIRHEEGISSVDGPTKTVTGNTINNITAGSGNILGMYLGNGAATNCSGNTITNITSTGYIAAISNNANDSQGPVSYANNTISNLSSTGTGGDVIGITGSFSLVPTTNINNNSITGLSSTGVNAGVVGINAISGQAVNIYDNLINNFSGSGTGFPTMYGIIISGGAAVNVHRNKIHTLLQNGAFSSSSTAVNGMFINGGTVNAYNNFISNLDAPNATITDAIRGIALLSATASTSANLYHNSIYINATSTGTNFGSSGVYHLTNTTATTGALTMIDNIIVNTSTPNGTGLTAAYRRSDAVLTNFAAASDHNLFYTGTPSASRLIFYDGTNSDQTLAAYQARVSARDANSISVMPNFVSATDLHLTTNNCNIDGRGTPVGTVTTDIDLAPRDLTTPDIGADEFTATTGTTLAGVNGMAVCEDRTVSVSGTTYTNNVCELIARLLPSGADPVAGKVNVCVTLDATQQYFNGEPYVQRHFDMEPTTSNQSSTSATITLYFTDAEFALYNTTNPVWPRLPTVAGGANTDPNRANVKVTQFHGAAQTSPSSPGNYPGAKVLITPSLANVFWNGNYWAVTFNITGFSGFYVHTNNYNAPLPVSVNYFTGAKQGSDHILNWKVTCNSTPRVTMELQRSGDSRNFSSINNITADAARCNQPFNYTDTYPLTGMNHYRLRMLDADRKVSYSGIVALLNAFKGFDITSIAPNPVVSDHFTLNVTSAKASKIELVIMDVQGRLVSRQIVSLIAGYNNLPIQVSGLAAGTYTIRGTVGEDRSRVVRFVKQ